MTIVEAVGWVLLHFVWQGAVVALGLAGLLALTGDGQARLRYALSCSALAIMLAATVATAVTLVRADAGTVMPAGGGYMALHSSLPPAEAQSLAERSPATVIPAAASERTADRTPAIVRSIAGRLMPWLVLGWLAGVVLLSVRLLGGWWTGRAIRRVGISAAPDWCQAQLIALSKRMRVTRRVAIVSSVRIPVPVIVGHLKPVIVLPAAALSGLSAAQVEAILAHELAHVRRHDYLVNLAQTVIETLLFYHPAVWWVSRQVREAREHCCDDLAVTVCRSRREYVSALLDLEELRGSTPALALGATDGSLLARGRRLLAPSQERASSPRLAASVIALTVVAVAVTGASFSPAVVPSRPEPEPSLSPAPATADARNASASVQRQAAGTTPVVVAPDLAAPLATRWSWAEGAARSAGRRAYWIGYSVAPVKTLPAFIYNDRSRTVMASGITVSGQIFSTSVDDLRFPGRSLAIPAGQDRAVKLLFEIAAGRGQAPAAVHISTLSLPVDTRDLPIFWLGPVEASQSLERLDLFYRAASTTEVKHGLVSAVGVHDASAAVVAWLERRIASQDPDEVRGDAAEWIAYHPIAASVAALDRTARGDRSSHVRQEAAEAVGDLPMPEAAPVLIELARSLTDRDARREAVEALGARPEPAASDALAVIARQDKDADIQREAVESLGDLEDKRGIGPLIELARSHPDVDVRREAIETLGDAMGGLALPLLKELVADRDPQIQEEAVDAIANIDQGGGLATLMELARSHPSIDVRHKAVEALGQHSHGHGESQAGDSRATVDLLTQIASSDRDIEVQIEAIETLGEVGGTAAVAELRKLATSHSDERARVEAVESLGESDAPAKETADFLKRLALGEKSTDVQNKILETLVDLRGGAGIAALIELAREHPSQDTRKEALERLIESDHPEARAFFERALKK